ncbi:hypothetical protein D3C84_834750 [compost metagenome]
MHKGIVINTSNTVLINSSPTRGRNTSASKVDQPVCTDTPMTKAMGSSASRETSTDKPITHAPPRPTNNPRERRRKGAGIASATPAGNVSGIN